MRPTVGFFCPLPKALDFYLRSSLGRTSEEIRSSLRLFDISNLLSNFGVKEGRNPPQSLSSTYVTHPYRGTKSYSTMDIRIQAIHFDATEQLKAFIQKKLDKLNRFADDIQGAEVVLKVVKPEISNNKEASIKLKVNGPDFFVDKTADSFEEAIDNCIDVLKRKLEKHKEA